MSTITIPPDIELQLAAVAKVRGTTPEILAVDCLRKSFVGGTPEPAPSREAGNSAEFLKDAIGSIDSSVNAPGGAQISENLGRKFADAMAEKRRQEHL